MTQESKDFSFLHFIVLIWGFTAVLGVLISIPSVELVFFRTLLSSAGLAVLIVVTKKRFAFRSGKHYPIILGTGVLLAGHWILFFLSARISNISVCLSGMATCSLWTSFLEPITSKKKIDTYEVILSILAFIGIAIIFRVEFDHVFGLLIAVISAFLAAVFTVINGHVTKREDPFVITFYEMLGACCSIALFFPFYLMLDDVHQLVLLPAWSDWGYLLVLALICTVFAYSYSVKLMQRLSAFSVNLAINLEPVYGILLALIFFPEQERMTTGFYLGAVLIIASVLIYPLLQKIHRKKALAASSSR